MHACSPVLDRDVALERSGGDAELLRELAELFLTEYPSQLASLSSAVERADTEEVDRAAHILKGSLANFGAAEALNTLLELEQAGRKRDLAGCEPALRELVRVLEVLHIELSDLSAATSG